MTLSPSCHCIVAAVLLPMLAMAAVDGDATQLLDVPRWQTPPRIVELLPPAVFLAEGRQLTVVEMHYHTGRRMKRCFVGWRVDADSRPAPSQATGLIVALPPSNGEGQGAKDLLSGIFFQPWPLLTAARSGVPFVAIDLPMFGAFPYDPFPTEGAYDPYQHGALAQLHDNLSGIMAARTLLRRHGVELADVVPIFAGGHSWGAIAATLLAGATPEVTFIYASSGLVAKARDERPFFAPPEWATSGRDYGDVLQQTATRAQVRLSFGLQILGAGGEPTLLDGADYVAFAEDDAVLWRLVQQSHGAISVHQHQLGHALDTDDLLSFFDEFVRSLP